MGADGIWDGILDEVIVKDDSVGQVEWVLSVDSSIVRAHQYAAGARENGGSRTAWVEELAVKVKASGGLGAG